MPAGAGEALALESQKPPPTAGEAPPAGGAPEAAPEAGPSVAEEAKESEGTASEAAPVAVATAPPFSAPQVPDDASTVARFTISSGGSVKALKRYIAGFSSGSASDQLGSQPPCRSYRYLMCLHEFEQLEERLQNARSKQEIAQSFAFFKPFKSAYTDLIGMTKAATNRLQASLARVRKQMSEDSTIATRASKQTQSQAKKKAVVAPVKKNVLESMQGIATEIRSVPLIAGTKHASDLALGVPAILRVDPKDPMVHSSSPLVKATSSFEARFATSVEHSDPGRVQRKFPVGESEAIFKFFGDMLPAGVMVSNDGMPDILVQALSPIMFAVAKNRETVSAETGHLATLRLVLRGTRKVLLVHTESLWAFMAETLKLPQLTMKKVYAWVKTASTDNLKAMAQSSQSSQQKDVLFMGTVGVNDVLYTPPGWVFIERIANADVVGVKQQVLLGPHNESIASLHRLVLASMEPNPLLQAAADALVLKAPAT